jgi:hypothetical protein
MQVSKKESILDIVAALHWVSSIGSPEVRRQDPFLSTNEQEGLAFLVLSCVFIYQMRYVFPS